MFTKTEKLVEVAVEEISDVKCDVCSTDILANKKDTDEASMAVLMFIRSEAGAIKENGIQSSKERESSDLCKKCYNEIIEFMRAKGAKVPSYYDSEDNVVDLFNEPDDESGIN
jgi:hypothetical protein